MTQITKDQTRIVQKNDTMFRIEYKDEDGDWRYYASYWDLAGAQAQRDQLLKYGPDGIVVE